MARSPFTKSGKRIIRGLAEFLNTETRIQKIVLMVHTIVGVILRRINDLVLSEVERLRTYLFPRE